MRTFFELLPTSNVPRRNKPLGFQLPQHMADRHKHTDGTLNHDDCFSFVSAPFGVFAPLDQTTISVLTSRDLAFLSYATARWEVMRSPLTSRQISVPEPPCPLNDTDVAITIQNSLRTEMQSPMSSNAFLHGR